MQWPASSARGQFVTYACGKLGCLPDPLPFPIGCRLPMSIPSTTNEFLDCLNASHVVDEKRLQPYLAECQRNNRLPEQPKALAVQLVRDGLLTQFQAQQLLAGRHRNFV